MRHAFTATVLSALGAILIVGAAHAADPIRIGMIAPITGGAAESGRNQINGAQMAADEVNAAGGVLGRKIELVIEDDQTTNPGAVLAFSKLTSDANNVAFIAPVRSTQVHAIAPDVLRNGKPVLFGGTDPRLTQLNNPWFFRFRPNDAISTKAMAEFGVKDLGKKKWAIIHTTDAFGASNVKLLTEALKEQGITPTLVQGFTSNSQDFTPIVLAVKQSGADIVASFTVQDTDQGVLAKQFRQFGVDAAWIGSPTIVATTTLKLAGPALYGTYALADYNPDSSPEAKAFSENYRKRFNVQADFFSAWTYDAVKVAAVAIKNAGGTEPKALQQALLAIKDVPGAEGPYSFNANGDGLHGYNVVRNQDGAIVFVKRVETVR